jgi:hypothetical protein
LRCFILLSFFFLSFFFRTYFSFSTIPLSSFPPQSDTFGEFASESRAQLRKRLQEQLRQKSAFTANDADFDDEFGGGPRGIVLFVNAPVNTTRLVCIRLNCLERQDPSRAKGKPLASQYLQRPPVL